MREVRFLPRARAELIEAFDWYHARSERVGEAFIAETDRQLARIVDNPLQFPVMVADIRRARLRRFPHSLFFRIVDGDYFVLACSHGARDPKVWQERG